MPRFDPRKHDLTRAEAKFLTGLATLSTRDAAREIETAARQVSASKAKAEKLRAAFDGRMKDALAELRAASKKQAQAMRDFQALEKLLELMRTGDPVAAKALHPKAQALHKKGVGAWAEMARHLAAASAHASRAAGDLASVPGLMPSARIVPSQPKVILMAP